MIFFSCCPAADSSGTLLIGVTDKATDEKGKFRARQALYGDSISSSDQSGLLVTAYIEGLLPAFRRRHFRWKAPPLTAVLLSAVVIFSLPAGCAENYAAAGALSRASDISESCFARGELAGSYYQMAFNLYHHFACATKPRYRRYGCAGLSPTVMVTPDVRDLNPCVIALRCCLSTKIVFIDFH